MGCVLRRPDEPEYTCSKIDAVIERLDHICYGDGKIEQDDLRQMTDILEDIRQTVEELRSWGRKHFDITDELNEELDKLKGERIVKRNNDWRCQVCGHGMCFIGKTDDIRFCAQCNTRHILRPAYWTIDGPPVHLTNTVLEQLQLPYAQEDREDVGDDG